MPGEKLLDLPYLKAKYDNTAGVLARSEQTMDKWHNEAPQEELAKEAKVDQAIQELEEYHAKTKRKPRNRKRRKKRDRQKDQSSKARGKAARRRGSNGTLDVASGETDAGGWVHPGEEEEVEHAALAPSYSKCPSGNCHGSYCAYPDGCMMKEDA